MNKLILIEPQPIVCYDHAMPFFNIKGWWYNEIDYIWLMCLLDYGNITVEKQDSLFYWSIPENKINNS